MFNLIKKDLILQKNLLLVYLLVLVLLLSSGFHFGFIVVLLSSLFLFNSQYYDDKEKSHVLLNSLPYTRKEIVSSKYVGGVARQNDSHRIFLHPAVHLHHDADFL